MISTTRRLAYELNNLPVEKFIVVIDEDEHSNTLANNIMKTIQSNFDTKQYISIQFK